MTGRSLLLSSLNIKLLVLEEKVSSIRRTRGKGKEHRQVTARPLPLSSLSIQLLVLEERASSIRRKRGNGGGTLPGDRSAPPSLSLL